MFQRTIKNEITFFSYGVYFKENVVVKCYPAQPNTGIIINGEKLTVEKITVENNTTVFKSQKEKIFLIEHFLAVLFLLKIDNLIIEIFGKEFPFFDGSGKEYYLALKDLLIDQIPHKKSFMEIKKKLLITDNKNFIFLSPKKDFSLLFITNFPNYLSWQIVKEDNNFLKVLFAQTPIPLKILKKSDFDFLKNLGYFKKGDWLLGKGSFSEHKLLDFFGNLKILNKEIKAKIIAFRPSHKLNIKLINKLIKEEKNGH
jgi:UDP-3-O-[3-hydroxymyristoyl] N-acetylglucosamine deacetylase